MVMSMFVINLKEYVYSYKECKFKQIINGLHILY
jgi:hypothetical protein